jgi:hypothetical protein
MWFLGAALGVAFAAGAAQASIVGDQVQIIEWYSTAGSPYGAPAGPFVIPSAGINFGDPGLSDVNFFITGSKIEFITDGTSYGSAPFNGFDVQDLNPGTTISGVSLDPLSAAFPIANLAFGAHDVSINLASSTPFATTGTVILDLSTGATSAVPEPASWVMMLFGLGGLGMALRAHRRRDKDLDRLRSEASA